MAVRIKLIFDGLDIKKCMFLVDPGHVLISDLERRIRKRFLIEKSYKLSLFIDDFLIPSQDSIELIHGNDLVVVRVTKKSEATELEDTPADRKSIKKRKRHSPEIEEQKITSSQLGRNGKSSGDGNNEIINGIETVNCKRKKKVEVNDNEMAKKQVKKKHKSDKQNKGEIKRTQKLETVNRPHSNLNNESKENRTEAMKLNKEKSTSSALKMLCGKDNNTKQTGANKKNIPAAKVSNSSSSSSDDSSSSSDTLKIKPVIKWNTGIKHTQQMCSSKQGNDAEVFKTAQVSSFQTTVNVRQLKKKGDKKHIFFESDSESSSDDETEETEEKRGKKTMQNETICDSTESGRQVEDEEDGMKENGGCQNEEEQKQSLEKTSNLPIAPTRDYSSLQPLIGPPRVGDIIAYKVLELSESYMPEVSSYKEGKVLEYDTLAQSVTLELCEGFTSNVNIKREGRFEMDLEDYMEDNIENDNKVSVQWSAVIAPRLIT